MEEVRWTTLMVAAQAGDGEAYAALLRKCVPFIRAVGITMGVPGNGLDDLVQDVLLTIHRARHTYDPGQNFVPWLRTIAQRRAIDMLRRVGKQLERELHVPAHYEGHPDPAPNAALLISRQDAGTQLRKAVTSLPSGQRQAVELLGLQEMSLDEASSQTGRSKTALKVNLHRALKALRQRLDGDG